MIVRDVRGARGQKPAGQRGKQPVKPLQLWQKTF